MSLAWVELPVNYAVNFLLAVLRNARLPGHIGFIMDGNRRFARNRQEPQLHGHESGSTKLQQVLEWCLELGVAEVSVYAFSVDNFKRTKEEVGYLMKLAEYKFGKLLNDKNSVVYRRQVRISFWGDLLLVPDSVRKVCEDLEAATRNFRSARLNILFAYSSEHERQLLEETGTSFAADSLPVDLIVRTSGETRLSDFMLNQLHGKCTIVFLDEYWPSLSVWSFARALLQHHLVARLETS